MDTPTLTEPVHGDEFAFSIEFLRQQAVGYRHLVAADLSRLSGLVGREQWGTIDLIHKNRDHAQMYEGMVRTRECLERLARPQ